MYARTIQFVLGPDTKWDAEHMADIAYYGLKMQSGFIKGWFLHNYETGECLWISFWETMDDLNKVWVFYPKLKALIGDSFQWELSIQVYDSYSPKLE